MIIAQKITEERKKNGWSQEELAEKLNVSRQSVSKWESAQSIPDLEKILQMAEIFGVSTDYLLKDEIENSSNSSTAYTSDSNEKKIRKITVEEANEFMDINKAAAKNIGFGVSLLFLSPVTLIVLYGLFKSNIISLPQTYVNTIGIVTLILFFLASLFFFITHGLKLDKFNFMKLEEFETAYGVSGLVEEKKKLYAPVFARKIATGVILLFAGTLPLVIVFLLKLDAYIIHAMIAVLLVISSIAINQFVIAGMINDSYETLLQEGPFSKEHKTALKKMEVVASIYWCAVVAGYLLVSFTTKSWNKTWVIWPVAGVLWGGISTIFTMGNRTKK